MKYTLLATIACSILVTLSCKKNNGGQDGYTTTTAYKNTLNDSVKIQMGRTYKMSNGKDTTVFYDIAENAIKTKSVYEESYFICTKNCPVVYYTSPIEPLDFCKMIIGDKVKIDTNCIYYYGKLNQQVPNSCGQDVANFFAEDQWNITKDKDGHILRKEYVIDAADLAETK